MNRTWQFLQRFITRRKPTNAVEMWMAVWNNDGHHVAIGAPSYEQLEKAWLDITGGELEPPMHVEVITFREEIDSDVDDKVRITKELKKRRGHSKEVVQIAKEETP